MKTAKIGVLLEELISSNRIVARETTEELTFIKDELRLERDGLGDLVWSTRPNLLNAKKIVRDLNLHRFERPLIVSSTNSELVKCASSTSIDRTLVTTEWQVGGRGRRGKTWASGFARHLTFSYGVKTNKAMSELGGLSLIMGLVVCEVINQVPHSSKVGIKWPNDLLCGNEKFCGILVELLPNDKHVDVIVGIGLNVELTEKERAFIDQPVTDVRSINVTASRSELLIKIVKTLQEFIGRFEESGFEPFIEAFNQSHIYHHKTCNIHQGDTIITGRVEGVDIDGALILSTEDGIRSFHGGEVSLRPT